MTNNNDLFILEQDISIILCLGKALFLKRAGHIYFWEVFFGHFFVTLMFLLLLTFLSLATSLFLPNMKFGGRVKYFVRCGRVEPARANDEALTENDSKMNGVLGQIEVAKRYSFFRKHFHVPSMWMKNQHFVELCEHRYETKDHKSAFTFIEERLRTLGYSEDNQRMLHDYMHYLLVDLLTAAGVPFRV